MIMAKFHHTRSDVMRSECAMATGSNRGHSSQCLKLHQTCCSLFQKRPEMDDQKRKQCNMKHNYSWYKHVF